MPQIELPSPTRLLPMLLALSTSTAAAGSPPTAVISNDLVTARIYLPDSDNGYYRGNPLRLVRGHLQPDP